MNEQRNPVINLQAREVRQARSDPTLSPQRQAVIDQARTWLGTPWHHQGRLKGAGVDCIGLIVGVARELGYAVDDYTDYQRFPDGVTMSAELHKQLRPTTRPMAGDIVCFRITRLPQHVAIITGPNTLIHAYQPYGVVETTIRPSLLERAFGYFTFREIEDDGGQP